MRRSSTIFLRGVVILIGCIVLALCIFALPEMATRDTATHPETAYLYYPFLIGAYMMALPFLIALYQAFKLLNYIDQNKAFSELSVRALRNIKYCAMALSGLIVAGTSFVMFFMEGDRAGIVALGIYATFASSVAATATAVFQRLLQNAVDIKSENDLTV